MAEPIPAKVVIAGLDNAGKTSLLIALDKKFEFEENVKKLPPTMGIQRTQFTFLNRDIIRWDFGGQEQYLKVYLTQMNRNLYEISLLFYVIDIQDQSRFPAAMEYFEKIVQFLREKEIRIPIVIIMNKYDPELKEDLKTNHHIMNIKEMVTQILGAITPAFYTTSIFAIDSIMQAFSEPLAQMFPRLEMIQSIFQDFTKAHPCLAMLLMDKNGITLADYYISHLTPNRRDAIRNVRILALKKIIDKGVGGLNFVDDSYPGKPVYGEIRNFPTEQPNFYLLVISENQGVIVKDIELILPRVETLLWDILKE